MKDNNNTPEYFKATSEGRLYIDTSHPEWQLYFKEFITKNKGRMDKYINKVTPESVSKEIPDFNGWISSKEQLPEYNVSVLVFIPEEDDHITTGMWDISNKWVLLDEYRVPKSQVTYWRKMVAAPADKAYIKSPYRPTEEDTMSFQIRELQKSKFVLESEVRELKQEIERLKTIPSPSK